MIFTAAGQQYRLFRVRGLGYSGLCWPDIREIHIEAGIANEAQIVEVIGHELTHATEAHGPAPRTAEERALQTGAIVSGFLRDWLSQGGLPGFLALHPTRRDGKHRAHWLRYRPAVILNRRLRKQSPSA